MLKQYGSNIQGKYSFPKALQVRPIRDRNPNSVSANSGLKKLFDILEESDQEEKQEMQYEEDIMKDTDKGREREQKKEHDQKQKKEQDQGQDEENEKEKEQLPVEIDAFPEKTKNHSVDGTKEATIILNEAKGDDQFLSCGTSLVNNEVIICSISDVDSVAVAADNHDSENDLINFSDSELEIKDDQPSPAAKIMM